MKTALATAKPAARSAPKAPSIAARTSRSEQAARAAANLGAAPLVAPAAPEREAGVATAPQTLRLLSADAGSPLPPDVRARYERRFAVDFGAVRVHTNADAAEGARGIRARAFTFGSDIVFGAGRYAPHTPSGARLLAHELTHVAQHAVGAPALLYRDDDPGQAPSADYDTKNVALTVSLSGLEVRPVNRYHGGLMRRQFWEIVLHRLAGEAYSDELLDAWLQFAADHDARYWGGLEDPTKVVKEGDEVGPLYVGATAAALLVTFLKQRDIAPELSEQQLKVVHAGMVAAYAWTDIERLANRLGVKLPDWYSETIFDRMVAQQGALLDQYEAARFAAGGPNESGVADALTDLLDVLNHRARILEAIRTDTQLAREPKAAPVLWVLWQKPTGAGPPSQLRDVTFAVLFLNWLESVPDDELEAAGTTHAGRVHLLELFLTYMAVLSKTMLPGGDEKLAQTPSRANLPPFTGRMTEAPELQPPLFMASLDTSRRFSMDINFPTLFDAFKSYSFLWERVEVPIPPASAKKRAASTTAGSASPATTEVQPTEEERTAGEIAKVREGSSGSIEKGGEKVKFSAAAKQHYARAAQYTGEDVDTLIRKLGVGPGIAASDLLGATTLMRFVGATARIAIDWLTSGDDFNHSEKIVTFPDPGLFIIRCRAVEHTPGDARFIRPPTVAYVPVLVRPAADIAAKAVAAEMAAQADLPATVADIEAMLAAPYLPADERKALEQLHQQLLDKRAADASVLTELQQNVKAAEQERDSATDQQTKDDAQEKVDTAKRLEEIHADRLKDIAEKGGAAGSVTRVGANFVSDDGDLLPLRLEAYDLPSSDGTAHVMISDLTTKKSLMEEGEGPTRDEAIVDGVVSLLSESQYGRGQVAIPVSSGPPVIRRVYAATNMMLHEALDDALLALTLAAIIAAPFTEGASLAILIPVGLVGAGESVYRIARRSEMHTFEWDLETWMDIVNIVASVAPVGRAGSAGLKLVRLSRVFLIIGIGANGANVLLMGAGIARQLDALHNLPPGQRHAEMLVVLGNALLQIGILAGSHMVEEGMELRKRLALERERFGPEAKEPPLLGTETTGTEAATPQSTMAGVKPPPKGGKPPRAGGKVGPDDPLLGSLAREGFRRDIAAAPGSGPQQLLPGHQTVGTFATEGQAYAAYDRALRQAPGREAGIYRNRKTGEYVVTVGDEGGVSAPRDGGDYQALLHFHPNPENATRFRLPAPQDWNDLIRRAFGSDGPVREFLEYDVPGAGRGRTEFGIDIGAEKPIYVKIYLPSGETETLRFAHDGEFDAYWGGQTVYAEPGSPLYESLLKSVHEFFDEARKDGFDDKTMAGLRKPPKGGKTPPVAGKSPTAEPPAAPLTTPEGDLTDAGIEYVRKKPKYEHKSADEIRKAFAEQGDVLEWITLEEIRRSHADVTDPHFFAIVKTESGKGSKPTIRGCLRQIAQAAKRASTGQIVNDAYANMNVNEFIESHAALRDIRDAMQSPEASPEARREWQRFYWGSDETEWEKSGARKTQPSKVDAKKNPFSFGVVGNKETDAVEVYLDHNQIVVIDASQQWNQNIHNFKTLFYRIVFELSTGMQVGAVDYRSVRRQRPIGQ